MIPPSAPTARQARGQGTFDLALRTQIGPIEDGTKKIIAALGDENGSTVIPSQHATVRTYLARVANLIVAIDPGGAAKLDRARESLG